LGDKPIIRIAVPGDSAEEFMQNAAKQFRGDFFVAIDQAVGKFVRIEAPFLAGDVAVRGDAIAMPAVRNGRKGLVIRLVKLDSDSLGIPIPEASKQMAVEQEESLEGEFDNPQPTMASPVSAAVAKSIRASASASDRAQPVKLQTLTPVVKKQTAQPTKLEDLDDETREAVNEFGAATTKASDVSADLAKQLAELEDKEPRATPSTVRRPVTPQAGVPKQANEAETPKKAEPKSSDEQAAADDSAFDSAFADAVDKAVTEDDPKAATSEPDEKPEDRERAIETAMLDKSAPKPAPKPTRSRVPFLVACLLIAAAGAVGIAVLKGWI
jgi:hypothetical protein